MAQSLDLGLANDKIVSVIRTSGNGSPGSIDTYTMTLRSGTTYTFQVQNGYNGVTGFKRQEFTSASSPSLANFVIANKNNIVAITWTHEVTVVQNTDEVSYDLNWFVTIGDTDPTGSVSFKANQDSSVTLPTSFDGTVVVYYFESAQAISYVPTSRTIAGIALTDNISASDLSDALHLDDLVPETRTIAGIDLNNDISVGELEDALGILNKVPETREIAGVDLQNDITKSELQQALDIDDIESAIGSINDSLDTKVPKTRTIAGIDLQDDITKNELQEALDVDDKVDKEAGKGLSTNDFTDAYKTKLNGIEAEANKTIVDSSLSDSSENPVQNKVITNSLFENIENNLLGIINSTKIIDSDGNVNTGSTSRQKVFQIDVSSVNKVKFTASARLVSESRYCFYSATSLNNCSSSTKVGSVVDYTNNELVTIDVPSGAKLLLINAEILTAASQSKKNCLDVIFSKNTQTAVLKDYSTMIMRNNGDIEAGTTSRQKINVIYISPNSESWEITFTASARLQNEAQCGFYNANTLEECNSSTLITRAIDYTNSEQKTILAPANAKIFVINAETITATIEEKINNFSEETAKTKNILDDRLLERRARFDNSFNYISYSGISASNTSINTAEMYEWACQHKFISIKGDVRLSSDNKLIMCHDAGFTLNNDGDIIAFDSSNYDAISSMTEAECLALKHADTGNYVCNLETLVRICKKYGKIPYITIRTASMEIIIPEMLRILDKYHMRRNAIINSFTYGSLLQVRKYDDDIYLSWVMEHNHQLTTTDIDNANKLGNCLICCYDYGGADETTSTNQSDEILEYARSKNIRLYEALISSNSELNDTHIFGRGFVGSQLAFLPEIFDDMN